MRRRPGSSVAATSEPACDDTRSSSRLAHAYSAGLKASNVLIWQWSSLTLATGSPPYTTPARVGGSGVPVIAVALPQIPPRVPGVQSARAPNVPPTRCETQPSRTRCRELRLWTDGGDGAALLCLGAATPTFGSEVL